jgi:zinc protease
MMFNGTKHVQRDSFWKFVEGAGGSDINGTTASIGPTTSRRSVESARTRPVLESDRMGYLLDGWTGELSNQQDVVPQRAPAEHREPPVRHRRRDGVPPALSEGHPYYANIIGSHADIQAAQLVTCRTSSRSTTAPPMRASPSSATSTRRATKKLDEKYFGPLKGRPARGEAVRAGTPPITSERRVVVADRVELPRVTMAWLSPPIYTARRCER